MSSADKKPRSHLPMPTPERTGPITYDARDPDTKFPPIEQLRPPKGAPNVLIILIDDAGFGSASAFGGSVLPNTISPLARTLKLNGYSTAQFGKCHEVPVWETSPVGPFDAWPTGGGGFEYFYGFIGGEANQWYPTLYEGTMPVEPRKTPEEGYHFMADMTDKAMAWISQQKALVPDKPFFVYFAPGATHAPHHVPKEWADKYEGKFDPRLGQAARRNHRPAEGAGRRPGGLPPHPAPRGDLGVGRNAGGAEAHFAPPDGSLCGVPGVYRPPYRPPARRLEQAQYLRRHARLLHHWRQRRLGRGHDKRRLQRDGQFQWLGGPRDPRIPDGAVRQARRAAIIQPLCRRLGACDEHALPMDQASGVALGRDPQRHDRALAQRREIRSQFHHVIDVAPTILEAVGLPEPISVNGVQQRPIEGVSMIYSFDDAKAAERRETQYFEMFGNRGIFHKGWTAVTKHATPWVLVGRKTVALDDDVWELYDTSKDWSQANDLAKQMPEKLHELQRLWLIEATRYNVLPIDDRTAEKFNPDTAGRPVLIKGNTQLLFGGMGRLSENCVLNIKNKSHSVTAEIEVPEAGAEGVIISQGTNIGGWSLYAKNGRLKYCYNVAGVNYYYVEAARALPASEHQVRMEFAYAGGGLGKSGHVTLYVDGEKVGEGAIPMTQAFVFSADDGCDVGQDSGAPVSQDYGPQHNAFNGTVKGVQLAIGEAAERADHHVSPEDAIRIAMARQ